MSKRSTLNNSQTFSPTPRKTAESWISIFSSALLFLNLWNHKIEVAEVAEADPSAAVVAMVVAEAVVDMVVAAAVVDMVVAAAVEATVAEEEDPSAVAVKALEVAAVV